MGKYIDREWVEKVNPVRPKDITRLRRLARDMFGKAGSVVVVKGRGSIPACVEVRVNGVSVAEAEMRHVEGDVCDILRGQIREIRRAMRENLSQARSEVVWKRRELRDAEAEVRKTERALAILSKRS